ncbi:MAG: molecular chaperone HtpG [bacterium]|nr:molecular chaperone HtpG [bacterium]
MSTKEKKKAEIHGNINVKTENILPIIKKWLYSEHDIFLRELISNSFDAINKLKKISVTDKLDCLPDEGKINITIDEKQKTITISDNGLGMDSVEIQKYINQIAFSGAEDFIAKYKDKDERSQIIGHFGLGFYSSFMVSDKVEIRTKSYKKGSKAIYWVCDGSTEFSIRAIEKKEVGTDVVLYINEDNKAFLSESKIKDLVNKYAKFLPVEIQVKGEKVNDQNPLWVKQPLEVKEEEYKEFYQKLFPFSQEPLFWIHLNVDYPFNLKGILYFPKLSHELDSHGKGQVKLFCRQVFVSENLKEVIPEFLTLLQGAIDCPDIPLNVSRSYLQNDPYVKKISKHIVKKVSDKLNEIYKKDKVLFEKYWEDINPFIKYGMMQNDDFYDKSKNILIFKSSNGYSTTISEYLERNKDKIENKVIYCSNKEAQASYVNLSREQGLEVIFLNSLIDAHFIQFLESKDSNIKYESVDSNISDHLVDKEAGESQVLDAEDKTSDDRIIEVFKKSLNNDKLKIQAQRLKNENVSAIVLESEQAKRMKTMSAMMKGALTDMFDDLTLVLNTNNNIIKYISGLQNQEKKDKLCKQIYDLALMSQRQLSGDALQNFISRSNELMKEMVS